MFGFKSRYSPRIRPVSGKVKHLVRGRFFVSRETPLKPRPARVYTPLLQSAPADPIPHHFGQV